MKQIPITNELLAVIAYTKEIMLQAQLNMFRVMAVQTEARTDSIDELIARSQDFQKSVIESKMLSEETLAMIIEGTSVDNVFMLGEPNE